MPGGADQTLIPFLWRAERLYDDTEIVSRTHEGRVRYDYADYADRARQLADVLSADGHGRGDRIATFCWNHHRHFETYFGVPGAGTQLHTINPLLPDHHVEFIVENADDRVIFVDPSLVEKLEGPAGSAAFDGVEQFVVMGDTVPDTSLSPVTDYESYVAGGDPGYEWPDIDEDQAAGMCYTSGTTGKPKGVEYTHQMLWAHTMTTLTPQGIPVADDDAVMPVVPMFHVNAWGLPFSTTAAGAKHVYPGPSPEPADLVSLIEDEGVTVSAGVPTVWLGIQQYLQEAEGDLSTLERVIIGGSAAPESLIRWYDQEHDVEVVHAWGMTEMSPIGTVASLKSGMDHLDYDGELDKRTKQGMPVPGLEMKVVDDDGNEVPWNGEDFGELLVRGPWVTREYFERPRATEEEFEDVPASDASGESEEQHSSGRWLRTGDVVTVDEEGYVDIVDRTDDVIKSGGEWISSVELENAIMAHDDVAEAAVVGVDHDTWGERPVAFVVPAGDVDEDALAGDIQAMIEADYPKWWRPDAIRFIDEIPKTATGKFSKMTLREEYGDRVHVQDVPEDAAPEAEEE
ncbi:fatty-acid--CoA ligase [Halobacteriales archaeon QS_8_69_26]|nr:MAG: fatty-acid--CoA ligase [Halobacteriales archaeon QS_8_69_26]